MSAVLRLIPEDERPAVERAALRVAGENWEWAAVHIGSTSAGLSDNLAYAVAAIAPSLDTERLRLLHRFTLWTFLLDNLMDDPKADPNQLRAIEADVLRTLDGKPAERDDDLTRTLNELYDVLCGYEADAVTRFIHALRDDIAATTDHAVWSRHVASGDTRRPNLDEYLELAAGSINYRSVACALLMLLDIGVIDESIADPALSSAARAVRLANDLRSARRHKKERTLHVLGLRDRDGRAVTSEVVADLIDQHVLTHDELLAALAGPDSVAARAVLVRGLRISVGVYRVGQLRSDGGRAARRAGGRAWPIRRRWPGNT